MILGDFDGHVSYKGAQKWDETGKMILDGKEIHNVKMLNDDSDCKDQSILLTWRRHNQESAIDYVCCCDTTTL